MKGNINMQKQKRITLNADKRKVIADVFQNHLKIIQNLRKHGNKQKTNIVSIELLQKLKWTFLLEVINHKKMLIQLDQ